MSALAKLSHKKSPRPKGFFSNIAKERHKKDLLAWIAEYTWDTKEKEIAICKQWLQKQVFIKTLKMHSYTLKHIIEREMKFYIANESLVQAILDMNIPYKIHKGESVVYGVMVGIKFKGWDYKD